VPQRAVVRRLAAALLSWRRPPDSGTRHAEHFGPALRAGRFVHDSRVVRRILLRVALFVLPGSVVWGLLPLVASRELGLVTVALYEQEGIDRGPVGYWAEPHLMLEPHLDTGPVLVTAAYRVPARNRRAFVAAMEAVRRARLRTGATRWVLFRDGEDPEQYVEVFVVPTWEEHLRQHELGGGDVAADERAVELAEGPPRVTHLLPPDSSD
jgi:hypothetical protein